MGKLALSNVCTVVLGLGLVTGVPAASQQADYDRAPIFYSRTPSADPVRDLEKRIAGGTVSLARDEAHGYLKSFLRELKIPVSSQTLVFSKTSFQAAKISPRVPRALYFNDDVYVGWVRGSDLLEVAAMDPDLGAVFYTISQEPTAPLRFRRQTDACLQCHDSRALTLGIPGLTVRSVYPSGDGTPHYSRGTFHTTYQSPYSERWGGWYVTGRHGRIRHLGNVTYPGDPDAEAMKRLAERGANLTDLSSRLDVEAYLAGTSDIVALMVLEYQTGIHDLLTRANHESRFAVLQSNELNRALGEPEGTLREGSRTRIASACEPLVEALFFSGEAALEDGVKGDSSFREEFEKRGPFDRSGRSLRQLDLGRRMFKYPMSYMIYSKAFSGLPRVAKEYVLRRMREILDGRDTIRSFAHLTGEDRKAITEILRDTMPEFAGPSK